MWTLIQPKYRGKGYAFLYSAIVWHPYWPFLIRWIRNRAEFLFWYYPIATIVCAFSGTLLPISSYVWTSQCKCCARGQASIGRRVPLREGHWIHCGLFSCLSVENILQYWLPLLAHSPRPSRSNGSSRGSHTSSLDSHQVLCIKPHILGTTCYLFRARSHALNYPLSRPTRWENTGVFCHLQSPLWCLLGRPVALVQRQDQRQPAEHPYWFASGLCLYWLIHQWALLVLAEIPEAEQASWQGCFSSTKGYCPSSHIPARLSFSRKIGKVSLIW